MTDGQQAHYSARSAHVNYLLVRSVIWRRYWAKEWGSSEVGTVAHIVTQPSRVASARPFSGVNDRLEVDT